MNKSILLFIAFFPLSVSAQVTDTIFYNNVWRVCNIQDAAFYRIAEVDTSKKAFTGGVKDYFASGELFMSGQYNSEGKKHGAFHWYYGSGADFMSGSFSNDSLVGVWQMYFGDGSVRQKIEVQGPDFVIWDLKDEQGNVVIQNGSGVLRSMELGVNPTVLIIEGEMQEGKRYGKWTFQSHTGLGRRDYKEVYKDGLFYVGRQGAAGFEEKYYQSKLNSELYCPPNLKAMEDFELDKSYLGKYRPASQLEVFSEVEQQPEYPGGMGAFYLMISRNLKYPTEARRMGLKGKVFVQFVIQKDGSVTEVEAIRGIGGGCDEEAVRVVKLSEKWIPGLQQEKAVKVRMILPISFGQN